MVTIGLKGEENCMDVYVDNDGKPDMVKMCADGGNALRSQIYLLYFAKKVATDCVRFKDKLNDLDTIIQTNQKIENELLEKRGSIEEVDGNRYEAFGKMPDDCRLPLQIMSSESPNFMVGPIEATPTPLEEDDEFTEHTDISKGLVVVKG